MKTIISELIAKETKLKKEQVESLIEIPPSAELGDYAFPCFSLASKFKKNPVEIAKELALKLKLEKEFAKIEAKGAYVNFFINRKFLAENILKNLNKKPESEHGKIVVEFLSPNTNKPLHLGHLRNMSIGESLSRILENLGNKVIRINLYNDRGNHICKSMIAYQKYGNNKQPDKKSDHFVGDFYALYSRKASSSLELEKENQEMLQKWESGDKEIIALWKKMNSWAIKGIRETYKKFGIKFDKEYYESQIYEKGREIIEEGLTKGIFNRRDDGAVTFVIDNEREKVLLRPDGTSVYITQDLYLAKLKYQDYKFSKSIYVVGNEQLYHFSLLFKTLLLLGYPFAENLFHLPHGMVYLPEGKMKSREGKVVDADDLIEEMQELAKKEIERRYKLTKKEIEARALKIALSAIKYFLLKPDCAKDMLFNPEEAISFEGNTGPYLQYSYARASSILRKSKEKNRNKTANIEEQEIALLKKISEFSGIIKKAGEHLNPSIIANYAFSLAQTFNEFYHSCPVLDSESCSFRLKLVRAFRKVMKNSLNLLGIEAIEEM